jgi:hypothetical protein
MTFSPAISAPKYYGDGSGLTSLPAAQLTGQVPSASLSAINAALSTAAYTNAANTFTANQTVTSSLTVTGSNGEFGVRISSNMYVVGYSSATAYYGSGSALTDVKNIGAYILGSSSITINTATYDIPVSTGKPYWFINLSSSTTLSFSNVVAGMDLTFAVKQSSNSKTITWPTSNPNVRWPASGNTLSTTTLKIDFVNVACPFVATECFGVVGPTGY